jgi:hypothetical protein
MIAKIGNRHVEFNIYNSGVKHLEKKFEQISNIDAEGYLFLKSDCLFIFEYHCPECFGHIKISIAQLSEDKRGFLRAIDFHSQCLGCCKRNTSYSPISKFIEKHFRFL